MSEETKDSEVPFAIFVLVALFLVCLWPYAMRTLLHGMEPKKPAVIYSDPFENPRYLINK